MTTAGREFFTVRAVSEALAEFRPSHRTPVETVALAQAGGRRPRGPVYSREALPGFDRSSVDGYAVRARDTFGASEGIPAYLRVTGAVRMGTSAQDDVVGQTAVAIPTCGVVPPGAESRGMSC